MYLWNTPFGSSIILTRRGIYATRVAVVDRRCRRGCGGCCFPYPSRTLRPQSGAEPQTRTIYVSATDKNGAAITDMQLADFEIKDGGKACAHRQRRAG